MVRSTLFLLACVFVPAAWGLLASWIYDAVEARRRHPDQAPTVEPQEPIYTI